MSVDVLFLQPEEDEDEEEDRTEFTVEHLGSVDEPRYWDWHNLDDDVGDKDHLDHHEFSLDEHDEDGDGDVDGLPAYIHQSYSHQVGI